MDKMPKWVLQLTPQQQLFRLLPNFSLEGSWSFRGCITKLELGNELEIPQQQLFRLLPNFSLEGS
jgi:hypothetical protein